MINGPSGVVQLCLSLARPPTERSSQCRIPVYSHLVALQYLLSISQAMRNRSSLERIVDIFDERFRRRNLVDYCTQEKVPFPLSVHVWTPASVARAETLNSGLRRRMSIPFVPQWAART
jgi:hypothetical protein